MIHFKLCEEYPDHICFLSIISILYIAMSKISAHLFFKDPTPTPIPSSFSRSYSLVPLFTHVKGQALTYLTQRGPNKMPTNPRLYFERGFRE